GYACGSFHSGARHASSSWRPVHVSSPPSSPPPDAAGRAPGESTSARGHGLAGDGETKSAGPGTATTTAPSSAGGAGADAGRTSTLTVTGTRGSVAAGSEKNPHSAAAWSATDAPSETLRIVDQVCGAGREKGRWDV